MKHRSKEEITKICDALYAIAARNWHPSFGYEVLVKGGIVLGIAHEEETRIKELEKKLEIATKALEMRLGSRVSLGAIRTQARLALEQIKER